MHVCWCVGVCVGTCRYSCKKGCHSLLLCKRRDDVGLSFYIATGRRFQSVVMGGMLFFFVVVCVSVSRLCW